MGATVYTVAVDVWSCGCVFAEMVTGQPLFEGDSEIDMLYRIFNLCGTPWNKQTIKHHETTSSPLSQDYSYWDDVEKLPNFSSAFPHWKRADFSKAFSQLPPDGIDLLEVCSSSYFVMSLHPHFFIIS